MPKILLKGDIVCECGYVMKYITQDLVWCSNPKCKHKETYEIPCFMLEKKVCGCVIYFNYEVVVCYLKPGHEGHHNGKYDGKLVSWAVEMQ